MKQVKNVCDLSTCMLCQHCLPEWKEVIDSKRKTYQYKKGELLFKEGEKVSGMFFVLEGVAKVHKNWANDKELIVRLAKKGDILGHRGLGADDIYPVSGTALSFVTVCYFDLAFFETTLKVNHLFLYELMLFFASELKVSERKMRNLAHMPVKVRMAQTLINLYEQFGLDEQQNIDINLSRQDIASYAGTTYETVFRIINEFSETGLVTIVGKSIRLMDINELKSMVILSSQASLPVPANVVVDELEK